MLLVVGALVVGLAPTTSADQVHLELASYESMTLPGSWQGLPVAMASDGTAVGNSSPPGEAIVWAAGSSTGGLVLPDGYSASRLNDVNDDHLAAGIAYPAVGDPVPFTYDIDTKIWTPLPLPGPGWSGEGLDVLPDGKIVGVAGAGHGNHTVVWPSATSAPIMANGPGEPTFVTPNGRIILSEGPPGTQSVWDPDTNAVRSISPPIDGWVAGADGAGHYLISKVGGGTVVWDSATGAMTSFVGSTGQMNALGHVLAWDGTDWVLFRPETGSSTPVRPFGRELPLIGNVVLGDGDQVLTQLDDGATASVVVWSLDAHSTTLVTYSTAGPRTFYDGFLLSADGLAIGDFATTDGAGFWRARFWLAPDAPVGLSGDVGPGTVALNWEPPPSTGDAPIDSYRVLSDGAPVAEVAAGTMTWSGPADGTHSYTVVAVNAYGESSPSNAVEVSAAATATDVAPAFTG